MSSVESCDDVKLFFPVHQVTQTIHFERMQRILNADAMNIIYFIIQTHMKWNKNQERERQRQNETFAFAIDSNDEEIDVERKIA